MLICIIKYIRSPAILTTSRFNLVISSNLAFVLYIIGHKVLNLSTGNEIGHISLEYPTDKNFVILSPTSTFKREEFFFSNFKDGIFIYV